MWLSATWMDKADSLFGGYDWLLQLAQNKRYSMQDQLALRLNVPPNASKSCAKRAAVVDLRALPVEHTAMPD